MIRASFGKSVARSMLIGGMALLAVPAIAGCEAGNNAPTLEFHSASAGAHATVNGMQLANVFVLGAPTGSSVPAGGSASLFVGLYNSGSSDETLQSVSAQGSAASVALTGGTVTIPAQGATNLTGPEPKVILKGLTKPLDSGQSLPVTFTFAHAGSVTLDVPIEAQSYSYSTFSPPPAAPAPTPKATGKAGKAGAKAAPTASGTAVAPAASAGASVAASPSATATKKK